MKLALALLAMGTIGLGADKARRRLQLSRAKHGSLAGHPRWSKRIAGQIPRIDYDEARVFDCDGAPADIVAARRAGFQRLADSFAGRFPLSRALTADAREGLSDLQFTGSYRVPFQFADHVRRYLGVGAFVQRSKGVQLFDLDGNAFYDLTGSYGVNLLGHDAYKGMIEGAVEDAGALGPVLGQLHPIVADTVARLKALTGLDEISFHMSGTEAVMQAVRLARYQTRRSHIVRFCGAYHGWWGEVQPGPGNPTVADKTYTLPELSEKALRILESRHDIACVLINPLQALHPNQAAPSDSTLVDGSRTAGADVAAHVEWLAEVRRICSDRGIAMILDDVFTGFRIAKRGAMEVFGIEPDMVTYGKTLGGGFPVGVVVGKAQWMKRFREDRPADICFARGTFNAHPYVMAAMNRFLRLIESDEGEALYDGLDARWQARAARMNAALIEAALPTRIAALSTIWTVIYDAPTRYNWMLQYYLRDEGLMLSWVGTGRLIFSLDYDDAAFAEVVAGFVRAGRRMQADGWWWHPPEQTNKAIRRSILRELIGTRLGRGRI